MDTLEQSLELKENPAPAATPEVMTPTTEEQLKTLQTQLETLKSEKQKTEDSYKSEKQKTEDSYKGLQKTLNKTNEELRKQADLKSELAELRDAQRMQAALIAEYLNKPEEGLDEDIKSRKPDLLKAFADKEKELEGKRQERLTEQRRQDYNRQADDIWTQAQGLKLPENDDGLLDIEDYLRSGNLKRAQAKIAKLQEGKKVATPEKKESEEDRINRLVEERLNKAMADKGLLKTDSAVPSGRAGSNEDIVKRYAEGDPSVSEKDFLKATGRG